MQPSMMESHTKWSCSCWIFHDKAFVACWTLNVVEYSAIQWLRPSHRGHFCSRTMKPRVRGIGPCSINITLRNQNKSLLTVKVSMSSTCYILMNLIHTCTVCTVCMRCIIRCTMDTSVFQKGFKVNVNWALCQWFAPTESFSYINTVFRAQAGLTH